MKIKRLEFGVAKWGIAWGYDVGSCGCKFLDLGPLYITWLSKYCNCPTCKKYVCECEE